MTSEQAYKLSEPADIINWLFEHPVPQAPSQHSIKWRAAVRGWGPETIPSLLRILRHGSEDLQYGAQMALRELGVEVWLRDDDEDVHYLVKITDEPEFAIRPRIWQRPRIRRVEDLGLELDDEKIEDRDPYRRIEEAAAVIESYREEMKALARIRALAIRELLDDKVSARLIAERLGVHPNYIYQLVRAADQAPAGKGRRSSSSRETAKKASSSRARQARGKAKGKGRDIGLDSDAFRHSGPDLDLPPPNS